MFRLTAAEHAEVVANCDHLARIKYSPVSPLAFTEHGALMLGNFLQTPRAVQVGLLVVRTFVQLREMLAANAELAAKLRELERRVGSHDRAIVDLIEAIRQLTRAPAPSQRPIGFISDVGAKR